MHLAFDRMPAFVINLDRSHDRWVRCAKWMQEHLPDLSVHRVSGIDGREYFRDEADEGPDEAPHGWRPEVLGRLQTEGLAGRETVLDPVRTALCLSHQRVLRHFLDLHRQPISACDGAEEPWALVFEDDVRPGEALVERLGREVAFDAPPDSEVLFLHDRIWKRGAWNGAGSAEFENWRVVRGGIGLEAYAVSLTGARKMLSAFRPVIHECDLQLMTFMTGYADLERREEIRDLLHREGRSEFPEITGYAPVRPLFQTDHWAASVKFDTIEEGTYRVDD